MVEILKSFEQVAGRFSPAVLVVPGLAMAALGLVAWLAGMCRRRLVLGLVAGLIGGLAGFFVGGQNVVLTGLVAGGGAVLGAGAPRLSAALLLAALGVVVAFGVLARGPLSQSQGLLLSGQDLKSPARRFTVQESLDAVQAYVLDVVDRVGAVARSLAQADLAIIGAAGAALLAAGLLLGRPAGALACSLVGSGLVFAGLTLLLIFKGSTPVAYVEQQGPFYGMVLLGMAAFGTLEQLLLCPRREPGQDDPPQRRSRRKDTKEGWRNR